MQLILGDCLEVLKDLPDNSVDAVVTDPPYGLSFMGKKWDYDVPSQEIWEECLRVLKPGGYLLAFAGTRTQHRMAVRIEDAGFEIRDMIAWVYGSGFPKSLNIGKAVDKLQGNERKIVGRRWEENRKPNTKESGRYGEYGPDDGFLDKGTSEWEGWGTALKPALEPITVARKPLSEKSVAENVLKWGTGGINIDESRVATDENITIHKGNKFGGIAGTTLETFKTDGQNLGRFPANLIHDNSEEVRECFPETVGAGNKIGTPRKSGTFFTDEQTQMNMKYDNGGSTARFFKSIKQEELKNCSVVINCAVCGKPKKIRASLRRDRNYCSLECSHKGKTLFNSQNVVCDFCGKEFLKKNSQMFTEKNFCSRECLGEWQSKFLIGENSYNWKDGKMDLISRVRSLKKMIDWRNEVYKRDNYTCQKCGDNTGGNLEAHHKKHLSDLIRELNLVDITDAIESKELWDIDNGITLCDDCHIETHKTESKKSVLYFAKASKSERNRGCEGLEEKPKVFNGQSDKPSKDMKDVEKRFTTLPKANNHPTVKPIALMEYLIKMVTPKGGTVLDPFLGSGSTAIAAKKLGYQWIGIEKEKEYVEIAQARINSVQDTLL